MKVYLITIFIFYNSAMCFTQSTSKFDSLDNVYIIPSTLRLSPQEFLNDEVKQYADSLNNWTLGDAPPKFLSEIYFDKDHIMCWVGLNIFSQRKKIFDETNNVLFLEFLICSGNINYDIEPDHSVNPCEFKDNKYLYYSVRNLARNRYFEITNVD